MEINKWKHAVLNIWTLHSPKKSGQKCKLSKKKKKMQTNKNAQTNRNEYMNKHKN